MADLHHHHDHGHDHGHSHGAAEVESQPALDAASSSLADALRMSFRILTFVIVLLVALFLVRGFFTVESGRKAVVVRFGFTDSSMVKDQGLRYALPYPIDEVFVVEVQPKTLEVNTFWSKTTEEAKQDQTEKGKEKAPEAVVPDAEDGFMLTGDLNVLQARWNVTYQIERDSQSVFNYYTKISDREKEQALVRSALQSAVLREMTKVRVAEVYPNPGDLGSRVCKIMNDMLAALECGMSVSSVAVIDIRPPKDVKASFDQVLQTQQNTRTMLTAVETDATKTLIATAGAIGPEMGKKIDRWWVARAANDAATMQQIENDLHQDFLQAGGECKTLISDANAYAVSVESSAKSDAGQFRELMKIPARDRKAFLEHARVAVLQDVIDNCYEKFLYHPSTDSKTSGTLELWINRDPNLIKEQKKIIETR